MLDQRCPLCGGTGTYGTPPARCACWGRPAPHDRYRLAIRIEIYLRQYEGLGCWPKENGKTNA